MNDLDFRIAIVKEKRTRAIESKTSFKSGKYSLEKNPPIAIDEVIEIENQYDIKFPAEYRAFITTIANGGFGLLSLQNSLLYWDGVEQEKKPNKDFLEIPFPHTFAYNPLDDPYILELGEKCDRGEITDKEFRKICNYLTAGTITISLEGCGYSSFMVITGETRGQVWFNADGGSGGYIPLNLSFLDWYEEWLDELFIDKYSHFK